MQIQCLTCSTICDIVLKDDYYTFDCPSCHQGGKPTLSMSSRRADRELDILYIMFCIADGSITREIEFAEQYPHLNRWNTQYRWACAVLIKDYGHKMSTVLNTNDWLLWQVFKILLNQ